MMARREAEAVPGVLRGLETKPSWRSAVAWRQVNFDRGPHRHRARLLTTASRTIPAIASVAPIETTAAPAIANPRARE